MVDCADGRLWRWPTVTALKKNLREGELEYSGVREDSGDRERYLSGRKKGAKTTLSIG